MFKVSSIATVLLPILLDDILQDLDYDMHSIFMQTFACAHFIFLNEPDSNSGIFVGIVLCSDSCVGIAQGLINYVTYVSFTIVNIYVFVRRGEGGTMPAYYF